MPLVAHWQRKKKTYLLGGLFLLVIWVLFSGLCNIQPEALQGLLDAGSWHLSSVPAASSTRKFSKALTLQPRHCWFSPTPQMPQQGNIHPTELSGVQESTAHLKHAWTRAERCTLDSDWVPISEKDVPGEDGTDIKGKSRGGGEGEKVKGKRRRRKEATKATVLKHSPLPPLPPPPESLGSTPARTQRVATALQYTCNDCGEQERLGGHL